MEFNMKDHGFATTTEFGELNVSTDAEHGFRPFQLMVASIVGCSGSVLKKVLTKMRVDYSDLTVTARVERNKEKANRIEKLHLHFVISGENLSQKKIEKAGAIARKNCGMIRSVEESIEVTESFEIVS